MTAAASLFDTPAAPVAAAVSDWVTGTLLGSVAISLCVIAVAIIGLLMMTGRFAVRESLSVVAGCFLLLGAPAIGLSLQNAVRQTFVAPAPAPAPAEIAVPDYVAPPELPPADYDPYAGASLRRD